MNHRKWALLSIVCFSFIISFVSAEVAFPAAIPEATRIQQFSQFQQSVLPHLLTLTKDLGLLGKTEHRDLADATLFGYQVALIKSNKPFGTWNDEVKLDTALFLYQDCFFDQSNMLKSLPPKSKEYINALANVKKIVYTGALDRYIVSVALRDKFYTITYKLIEERKPKNLSEIFKAEEIFNFEILNQAEKVRLMFK